MSARFAIAEGARRDIESMHPGKTLEEILGPKPCDCEKCKAAKQGDASLAFVLDKKFGGQ